MSDREEAAQDETRPLEVLPLRFGSGGRRQVPKQHQHQTGVYAVCAVGVGGCIACSVGFGETGGRGAVLCAVYAMEEDFHSVCCVCCGRLSCVLCVPQESLLCALCAVEGILPSSTRVQTCSHCGEVMVQEGDRLRCVRAKDAWKAAAAAQKRGAASPVSPAVCLIVAATVFGGDIPCISAHVSGSHSKVTFMAKEVKGGFVWRRVYKVGPDNNKGQTGKQANNQANNLSQVLRQMVTGKLARRQTSK